MAERGLSLDPYNPFAHMIVMYLYYHAGRAEQALKQRALALAVNPQYPGIFITAALAHERRGDMDEAIAGYRKACEQTGDAPFVLSFLTHALAVSGREAEGREVLQRLLARPGSHLDLSIAYAGLRDRDATLAHLEAAARERDIHMQGVPADRRYDWLRSDPRFQAILQQMGLKQ